MKKHDLSCGIALGAFLLTFHCATAAPVTVPNFSFESPDLADGVVTSVGIPDWTAFSFRDGSASVYDPTGPLPANGDGAQEAELDVSSISGFPFPYVTFTSAASLLTITSNTTYTLTVAIASPGFGLRQNSTVSLFAGGTSAASVSTTIATANFVDFTTSFTTAPSGDPLVGLPLTVELRLDGNSSFNYSSLMDNVRVDATSAPEPSALLMGCAGLAALGMRRGRSAHRPGTRG